MCTKEYTRNSIDCFELIDLILNATEKFKNNHAYFIDLVSVYLKCWYTWGVPKPATVNLKLS